MSFPVRAANTTQERTMKQIICPRCNGPAVGPGPNYEPIVMGRFTSTGPLIIKCGRCTDSFRLKAQEFFRLPDVPVEVK